MKDTEWAEFAKSQATRQPGVRMFGTTPAGLEVDKACPDCGKSDRWTCIQVLGETAGRTDTVDGKLVPVPAQRGGLKMKCMHCFATYTYRDVPFSATERAELTTKLHETAKIGRI